MVGSGTIGGVIGLEARALALLALGFVPRELGAAKATVAIDRDCNRAQAYAKANHNRRRKLVNTSPPYDVTQVRPSSAPPPRTGEASWHELKSDDDLFRLLHGAPASAMASAWRDRRGVTFIEASFVSLSGSWDATAEWCYRADGTLARVSAHSDHFDELDADGSPTEYTLARHHDARGAVIASTSRCSNFNTHRDLTLTRCREGAALLDTLVGASPYPVL